MKIDWSKYQEVISNMRSTEMEHIIHDMVKDYLHDHYSGNIIKELKHLGILTEETEKQIVKPFNFMDNDRS